MVRIPGNDYFVLFKIYLYWIIKFTVESYLDVTVVSRNFLSVSHLASAPVVFIRDVSAVTYRHS